MNFAFLDGKIDAAQSLHLSAVELPGECLCLEQGHSAGGIAPP